MPSSAMFAITSRRTGISTSQPAAWSLAGDNDSGKGQHNWASIIGIVTAIVGNILIALAINVQRYAHIRLHRQRARTRQLARAAERRAKRDTHNGGYAAIDAATSSAGSAHRNGSHGRNADARESDPLIPSLPQEESTESTPPSGEGEEGRGLPSTYLRSPYWWLGQVLITLGEMGNFLAYGFAPASIVSPLGVVALISNCVIGPIIFHEKYRHRDFWGVAVAVAGVVTVVMSASQEETRFSPDDIWDAITTIEFEVYLVISTSLIALLMWASGKYGRRTILIDLGLVGLFGGYTALATKGVSSMLSSTLLGAFATPVTYVLGLILVFTAVMQVRYVNRALQRFDSTQVIPIQFVMFTLCVIIGSAILYRDFERTTTEQAVKFVGGCLLTFFGVFLITSGRSQSDDDDLLSDVDGVEETIGLAEQDLAHIDHHAAAPQGSLNSRRSSKSSRVSFVDGGHARPFSIRHNNGVPSLRTPVPPTNKASPSRDAVPVMTNPWRNTSEEILIPPGIRTISSDTIVSGPSSAVSDAITSEPSTPSASNPVLTYQADQHATPRPSHSSTRPQSRHFAGPIISPSPFSSAVSAVMKDTLRGHHGDSPIMHKSSMGRIRSSLRASLFIASEENQDEEDTGIHEAGLSRETPPEGRAGVEEAATQADGRASKGLERRARSLSDTITEFFRTKRRKRGHNPEAEDGSGSGDEGPNR